MIGVDTNILVYAHRADSEWNSPAFACLRTITQGPRSWAIPWPCIHEFLAIVTHPRIYTPPSTLTQALDQVDAWLGSPSLQAIGESSGHWAILREQLRQGRVSGPRVHDARIAAICISHGVSEFLSAGRDFSHFPKLKTRNPLQD